MAIAPGSTLTVTIEQVSRRAKHTLGRFRLLVSDDERAGELARTPENVLAALRTPSADRTESRRRVVTAHYQALIAPELKTPRGAAAVEKELAALQARDHCADSARARQGGPSHDEAPASGQLS